MTGAPEQNLGPAPEIAPDARAGETERPAPVSGKRYLGERTADGVSVVVIPLGGETYALNPRYDLRNHSPDGYNFGYPGSGPAQLSLALLADALGDDEKAQQLYQDYKFKVVARWTGDRFDLTDEEIRRGAAELEAERGRKRT